MIKNLLILSLLLLVHFTLKSQVSYNANVPAGVPAYNAPFYYGVNPGAYWAWDDKAKADIAAGNPALGIKGAGVKSFHAPLPENFLETWSYDTRIAEFNHYASLGMKDHTVFLETPTPAHKDNNKYGGCTDESLLFKNLYEPIWDGGANGTPVNELNYYALYVYKTVSKYKAYTKFWEVINEPDMGPGAFDPKGTPGNWWENAPSPCNLTHLKAPIYHYIRMLRITYDVVKTLDPSAYVSPGGVGSGSFLDAVLRYTDNPVDGSVTAAYPAKGGAYFDALSFHFYPMYSLLGWQNGVYGYNRHSDAAINLYINHKNYLTDILASRGYNGITYPKKIVICSENGIPNQAFGDLVGSDEVQKNYVIKAVVESQKNDIRQFYWFILGDAKYQHDAVWEFDKMGFYKNLNYNGPIQGPGYLQEFNNSGIAHKTTSDLLFGYRYDAAKTALMNLPANIGGAAFFNNTEYRYVLWAKTTTDRSEVASATYSFPLAAGVTTGLKRREWNFTQTGVTTDISSQNIILSATPSFFLPGSAITAPAQPPVAQAGTDATITLPVSSVTLNGSLSTAPGGSITTYAWTYVSGPSGYTLATPNAPSTAVSGLQQGSYVFRLTVTNNLGLTSTDDVAVTVNPLPAPTGQPPVANAGADASFLASSYGFLNGTGSTAAAGSTITKYLWTAVSGPTQYYLTSPSDAGTFVKNAVAGTYVFRLTVTDDKGLTSSDDVVLTVTETNPQPQPVAPVANAGSDQSIILPVSSVTLNASASSAPGGTISKYAWTYVSGPSGYAITSPATVSTSITGLVQGVYTFRITITNNSGLTASDDVSVTVAAPVVTTPTGQAPVANAGDDISMLASSFGFLNGTKSAAAVGNTLTKYAWTAVSGPSQYYLTNPNEVGTFIKYAVVGVYTFRLTVTDNKGVSASDDVVVTVTDPSNPAPQPAQAPVANAGADQNITLPLGSVTLNGSGSSAPGSTISKYNWTYVSGPAGFVLSTPMSVSTTVSGLLAGQYVFRLTVTNSTGLTATDDVIITVNPAIVVTNPTGGPVANAGDDVTMLASGFGFLNGTKSTASGGATITKYLWSFVSGPSLYYLVTPADPGTFIKYMTVGTYIFRLTVTDSKGLSASDDVKVVVNAASGTLASDDLAEVSNAASTERAILFPNPAVSVVNLRWTGKYTGNGSLTVIDAGGLVVKRMNISKQQDLLTRTIDVSGLKSGVYTLHISLQNGKQITEKFFKN